MRKVLILAGLGLLLLLVGFRLYQELSGSSAVANSGFPGGPALLVETATVEPHVFENKLQVLGELQPRVEVQVMSRISGRLKEVFVDRGDPVSEGRLLALVDDTDLVQQIRRAEAAVAVAQAGVARERAVYENLVLQVERFQALRDQQLISAQELEDLKSRLAAARAQLELARAQVEQSEASLRELNIQQEQTRIYSPLNGFVATRHLDPGALVNPSAPIVSVLDVARLRTVIPVTEPVLPQINIGLPARISVDAYPERSYSGKITRVSPFLNPQTRTADVEIELSNPDGNLKPGMFARVTVDARVQRTSLSIPRAALLTRGAQKGVYILSREKTSVFRPVDIGRIEGDVVELLEGLQKGDIVVSTGAQNLNEGDRVRTQ